MGWVAKTFQAKATRGTALTALWNEMRDSIGIAVEEFRERSNTQVDRKDCASKARHCMRLTKDTQSIEVYLDEKEDALKITSGTVCGFRFNQDITGLEYFDRKTGSIVDTERACQMALEKFFFGGSVELRFGVVEDIKARM